MSNQQAYDTFVRLLRKIAPEADMAAADRDAPLQEVLDIDSMDFLNLLRALHDETGIDVPDRDYPLLATIDGWVAYVAARLDARSGGLAVLVDGPES